MSISALSFDRVAPDRLNRWLRANVANRRTRFLLAAFCFVAAAAGATILDSLDSKVERAISERQRQLASLARLGEKEVWHQRRAETDLSRVQAETTLWEAETDGLAQANFQSWILDQAAHAGVGQVEIHASINANPSNALKLRQLTAQVAGRFEAAAFFRLLQAIAAHDRLLVVNRLEIQTVPVSRFDMVLGTFLRPAPPPRGR